MTKHIVLASPAHARLRSKCGKRLHGMVFSECTGKISGAAPAAPAFHGLTERMFRVRHGGTII
jgi:hypothetical protein